MSRLATEREFHDEQAARRRQGLTPDKLRFNDDSYLDHETWIRPAVEWLGDLSGQRILDLGCGHGMAAVVFARRGAIVTGLDLSVGYLREASDRAAANGVSASFVEGNAERLPFADASFDRVWGHAIVHHLDVSQAASEIARVLRPGGCAVVCEPWGGNPMLNWARRRLHYWGKARTADEDPLRPESVALFRRHFPNLEWRGYQLAGMLRRVYGDTPLTRGLSRIDRACLRIVPLLRNLCRYAVFYLPRP
jgi:SAM-dependent methyltransferase